MPGFKAKSLSSLFCTATRIAATKTSSSSSTSAEDATLKHFISSLGSSSGSMPANCSIKSRKRRSRSNRPPPPPPPSPPPPSSTKSPADFTAEILKLDLESPSDDPRRQLSKQLSSILCGGSSLDSDVSFDSIEAKNGKSWEGDLEIPWFPSMSSSSISLHRKAVSRCRKQKWIHRSTQNIRFDRLVRMCAQKLGADAAIQVFGKLGRETGVKEYNALIKLCIEKARETEDEEASLQELYKAYQLLKSMREQGFQLEEETYGSFLMFLIDMGMIEEFQIFCGVIIDQNPDSKSRLAYYEMLLWIRVNNEDKVQELCNYIVADDGNDNSSRKENYLLALCESNWKKEILQLLELIDITKFSSLDHIANIFRSLGRLLLEPFAVKFILALKTTDIGAGNISNFIYHYAISMPNSAVDAVISKFRKLYTKLEVVPSSISCETLIQHCCDSLKVHMAVDMVEDMFEAGLSISLETCHSILHACEDSCDYNLVHRIYSEILRNNLKPTNETFRIMIHLCTRMKDFESVYGFINDLEGMNLIPTTNMYNSIMAGYFREKNIQRAQMVLKEMEDADVKPDSQTFSYLIGNCDHEEDIIKYHEKLKRSGVQVTKHVLMALINAYAACGQFEKAKQVVLAKNVPVKSLNELRSVLVSALASHGQISNALDIYREIKKADCNLAPKMIVCLIEHLQSEGGQLRRMLQLLEELTDPVCWIDGCWRVILRCVEDKHLSTAVDLLKQFKDKTCNDEMATEVLCDEVFSRVAEIEPVDLQFGLDLLQAIKELGVHPSRKGLDFLLTACARAKDLHTSLLIWKEYQKVGLPYNVLSFLRMYQALLAAGDQKAATSILKKIPQDDPHVRCVVKACQETYINPTSTKEKETKKKEKMKCFDK